jgi:hypothetical protein
MEGTVRHHLEWTRAPVLKFRTSLAGDLVRRQVRTMGRKAFCFARSSPLRAQAGLAYPVLYRSGARMLRWPASRTRITRQARPHCSSRRCPPCCALRTQVGHRAKVRKVPKLGNERCCYTGSTGGPSTLLARLLNFDSRALPENSVRRAGSNSPPRSGPRSELRRGPGPNSVHSFFGNFESSPPVGGQTRKVDLGRALRRFQPR